MAPLHSCTILLVEDEAIIALNETASLRNAGYEVVHVFSGEDAVEQVESDPSINLVLMDIDLGSGINGSDAAEEILALRELPIVFLTSHGEREMVERVRKITRYGYVLKSAGDFVLRESIEMALELFAAHQSARHELAKNDAILRAIPDLTFVMTVDGTFVEARAPDPGMLATPVEAIPGTNLRDIYPAEEADRHLALYRRCHATGEVQTVEYTLSIGGTDRVYEARITRMDERHLLAISRDVTDIRERERMERAAGERHLIRKLDFQRLVAGISADFMRVRDEEMDPVVEKTLAMVGEFFAADRCYLVEFSHDQGSLTETHEWSAPDVTPVKAQLQGVDTRRYTWILDRILAGDTVMVPDINDLPLEADPEREQFKDRGVRSILAVPLVSAERTEGYLGLHAVRTHREWTPEQVEQVRVSGEIIAHAVARRRALRDLAQERLLMNVLMDRSPDYIYFKDRNSRFLRVSRSLAQLHGENDPGRVIGLSDADRFPPKEAGMRLEQEQEIMETGRPMIDIEEAETQSDGSVRWRSTTKGPVYDNAGNLIGLFGISRDITERKEAQQEIEAYVHDQELLLREVHHRVRNTMNTIRSLVSLQVERVADENARAVMAELQSRIVGMITVYDQIDTAADFRHVSVSDYLTALVESVGDAFGRETGPTIEGAFVECTLDSRVVFPLGLIVNELLTNAWKYGYPEKEMSYGRVDVSMHRVDESAFEVRVTDDGVGLPEGFSIENSGGMGLGLVAALTNQIHGTFSISRSGTGTGTQAILRFPG